jgi:Fur family zinc uptake transcriptional regulator
LDAEELCGQQKKRFTNQRKEVLRIIATSEKALGAYDILEQMNLEGKRQALVTAYRALGFLLEMNFVHRLNSLNAFVACISSHKDHTAQFLICHYCKYVGELNNQKISDQIEKYAIEAGFEVNHQQIEIIGKCNKCP